MGDRQGGSVPIPSPMQPTAQSVSARLCQPQLLSALAVGLHSRCTQSQSCRRGSGATAPAGQLPNRQPRRRRSERWRGCDSYRGKSLATQPSRHPTNQPNASLGAVPLVLLTVWDAQQLKNVPLALDPAAGGPARRPALLPAPPQRRRLVRHDVRHPFHLAEEPGDWESAEGGRSEKDCLQTARRSAAVRATPPVAGGPHM